MTAEEAREQATVNFKSGMNCAVNGDMEIEGIK